MKRVKVIVEKEMGVFQDGDDLSEKHILEMLAVWDSCLIENETPLQIVVTDLDTGLITNLISLGESTT